MALLVFVASVLVVLAGALLTARLGAGRWSRVRVATAGIDRLGQKWGGPALAAGCWAAGVTMIMAVMWLLGELVSQLEGAVDVPAFRWFAGQQIQWWTGLDELITQLGNTTQTRVATVIAAVGLAVIRLRRGQRAWVPLLILPAAYVTEHYSQGLLAGLVDRGHPPTSLGTWPSGGVTRTILVYGLVVYFLLVAAAARRTVRVAGWTTVAVLGTVEAYTRVYLLKHWLTDVLPGGLLFGGLLLLLFVACAWLLDRFPLLPGRGAPVNPAPVGRSGR